LNNHYILNEYDPAESHHGASAIAMWEAIKFTKEELGLNQFDFEGSMIQPVEQFFRTLLYRFLDKAIGEIVAGCDKYNWEGVAEGWVEIGENTA